ncbi:MAG: hypothetical protein HY279_10120 [Nitrospinae bacterium]|nr:hypothetical protein [Nitrospinota bacterium]
MRTIEYTATLLSDGHLSMPKEIKEELGLDKNSLVQVAIAKKTKAKNKSIKDFFIG